MSGRGHEQPSGAGDVDGEVEAVVQSVFPLALLLCRDRDVAEDVMAESVARIMGRWRAGRIAAPRAYLRTTVLNEVRQRHRRDSRVQLVPLEHVEVVSHGARQEMGRVDAQITLLDALAMLGERQRMVVVLRFFEDLPLRDIAELTGTSQGTVKSQLSRGLERLRAVLGVPMVKEGRDG